MAVAALLVRLAHIDHAPIYDELYHLLAARSFIEEGDLCIADCGAPYNRAALYTFMVAAFMKLGGPTLVAARLTSVLAGVGWVLAVYAWTRRVAGKTAGLSAGLLMCLAPGAIFLSQVARFYIVHGLIVWIACGATFFAVTGASHGMKRGLVAMSAIFGFVIAYYFQVTSLIPLAAALAWTGSYLAVRHRAAIAPFLRRPIGVLGLVLLLAAVVATAARTELGTSLWSTYRWTTRWAMEDQSDVRFFHHWFIENYAVLYTLLPVAILVSVSRFREATTYAVTLFAFCFLAHSFSGFKATRVFYYFVPFFFAVWGMALGVLLPELWKKTAEALRGVGLATGSVSTRVAAVLVGLAALFAAFTTEAWNTTLKMVTRGDEDWPASKPPYRGYADWPAAAGELRELSRGAEVVLSSDALPAYFYLGRVDGAVSVNQLFDDTRGPEPAPEFRIDWRGGWPVFSTAESMALVMKCYRSGVFIAQTWSLDNPAGVPTETTAFVKQYMENVPVPSGWKLQVFRWTGDTRPHADDCPAPPLKPHREAVNPRPAI